MLDGVTPFPAEFADRYRALGYWEDRPLFAGFTGWRRSSSAIMAVREHGVLGFHFHPIMGHFAVDDPALGPLFETIAGLRVPVMTGDHHGWMTGRATLLVRAADEILARTVIPGSFG